MITDEAAKVFAANQGQKNTEDPAAPTTADAIRAVCHDLAEWLVGKNVAYGDSALDPVRVFSRADPVEQIRVRLDDKLSRLMRGHEYAGDDTVQDLTGYLVLLLVAQRRHGEGTPAKPCQ